jgi:hypothetical protein
MAISGLTVGNLPVIWSGGGHLHRECLEKGNAATAGWWIKWSLIPLTVEAVTTSET